MPELNLVAESLKRFGGDPQKAGPLALVLGFTPVSTPVDLLAGHATPLSSLFNCRTDRFGVQGLYRVGGIAADPGSAGFYVAVINNWGTRPAERDRARRRIARALVEHSRDNRSLFVMVQDAALVGREAEFVLPRVGTDGHGQGPVSTVRAVVDQILARVLTEENLTELVKLVNEELAEACYGLKDQLDAIDAELHDVKARLSKLYEALETGKLAMEDLAPRIKELRVRQDELSSARVIAEAEMAARGADPVDLEVVRAYARDLYALLKESELTERKGFLRSFVKRIDVNHGKAVLEYRIPLPAEREANDGAGVLCTVTPGGAGVTENRTFRLEFSLA